MPNTDLDKLRADLTRCDREIAEGLAREEHSFYAAIGYSDWHVEKWIIQEEIDKMEAGDGEA